VLAALSPLFRYSDWRYAWVLRVIGERYGPVLLRPEPEDDDFYQRPPSRLRRRVDEYEAPGSRLRRWLDEHDRRPSRPRRRVAYPHGSISGRASRVLPLGGSALLLTLGAAVILAAAALGYTVAHSGNGGHGSPALNRQASSGPLRLSFATGWRPATSPVAAQLGLQDAIAWAPSALRGETLTIGRGVTADPQLLPRPLLASLPSEPTPQTVTLGGAQFYRYLNLTPRGEHGSESVYAMSTTIGTVLGVCIAPQPSTSFTSSCERSLGTLALTSGKALPPGPIPAYASALNLAIQGLNDSVSKIGSRLRSAPTAKAQAQADYALAAAHAQAATALSHLTAGPASAANTAVVAALKLNDTAYRALGRAASLQDATDYSAAQASLKRAASALTAAYSRLDAFGYRVS
jgi:hypothetical protein